MLRWRIACLVSAAIAVSYLDRQTLPVAIKAIEQDIPITNEQFSFLPVGWALAIFSLAYFGQQSWSTLVMTLPADMYPRHAVGTVAGLVGFGGAMGGVVFGQLVGYLLDRGFGYGVVFTLAGSFHVLAFAIICVAIPTIGPVSLSMSSPRPSTSRA